MTSREAGYKQGKVAITLPTDAYVRFGADACEAGIQPDAVDCYIVRAEGVTVEIERDVGQWLTWVTAPNGFKRPQVASLSTT